MENFISDSVIEKKSEVEGNVDVNIEMEIEIDDDIEITLPKKGSSCTLEYF